MAKYELEFKFSSDNKDDLQMLRSLLESMVDDIHETNVDLNASLTITEVG